MAITIPGPLQQVRPEGEFSLNGDVQLSNLVLNEIDADGTLWIVSDVEGWWTIPEPEVPDYPRGWDDGSYETVGRYASRVFTLTGSFFPSSPSKVAAARQKLIEASNLCRQGGWFLTNESDYARGSQVWLSGQPMIQTVDTRGRTDFSIGLKAPDPVKYSLNGRMIPGWYSQVISGSGGVTNAGNYVSHPVLLFDGMGTITNNTTGQVMPVVKSGSTLEINCMNRSVSLNGDRNKRTYLAWDTDWIELDPGYNSISVSGGTLTVQWRHAWIG